MNFIACVFQASEVPGTLSKKKQNSFISKTCASGILPTFILNWSTENSVAPMMPVWLLGRKKWVMASELALCCTLDKIRVCAVIL